MRYGLAPNPCCGRSSDFGETVGAATDDIRAYDGDDPRAHCVPLPTECVSPSGPRGKRAEALGVREGFGIW